MVINPFYSFLKSIGLAFYRGYRRYLVNKLYKDRITLIKQVVKKNKGLLVEHAFFASLKHKELTKALHKNDAVLAREKKLELDSYLSGSLIKMFKENSAFVIEYFTKSGRSDFLEPRISIKIPLKNGNKQMLKDLLRYKGKYSTPDFTLESNSGIKDVYVSNNSKVINNIPKYAGAYTNLRLDLEKAKKYENTFSWRKWISNFRIFNIIDTEWIDCWETEEACEFKRIKEKMRPYRTQKHNPAPPAEACYKSTVIIPISLSPEDVSTDFLSTASKIACEVNKENSSTYDERKFFFGFLFVDHHWREYFDEKNGEDLYFLQIVSEALAMQMFTQSQYTVYSNSYNKTQL